jgi:uncharacterized glyoxalase superfamily protein PhnB
MPHDVLIPVLGYPSVGEAIHWLTGAFEFVERWRAGEHRAQLAVGPAAAIAIVRSPAGGGARIGDHVMVRVEEVDAHHAAARRFGAQIIASPSDYPYGERQYTALDHSGRAWVFTQSIADVAPEDWGGATPA